MDDQGGEGEGGETRDGQEGVVIGKHRRFAGDLLAEQDGALGIQQRLVGDDTAIGAGELLRRWVTRGSVSGRWLARAWM